MTNNDLKDGQVGGSHYADMAIQPWDVIEQMLSHDQVIGYHIGTVIAYLMRHKAKGGDDDIRKAAHHMQKLVAFMDAEMATAEDRGSGMVFEIMGDDALCPGFFSHDAVGS